MVAKTETSSYKIHKSEDIIMYNTMTIVNTIVWYLKVAKRVNPKNSHHKANTFSFYSLIFFLYPNEMMDVN